MIEAAKNADQPERKGQEVPESEPPAQDIHLIVSDAHGNVRAIYGDVAAYILGCIDEWMQDSNVTIALQVTQVDEANALMASQGQRIYNVDYGFVAQHLGAFRKSIPEDNPERYLPKECRFCLVVSS